MVKQVQIVAFAIIVIAVTAFNVSTVLDSNRSYDLSTTTIAAISGGEDGGDSGEGGENSWEGGFIDGESGSGGRLRQYHVDNHEKCTVKETYNCSIGVKIPSWVPWIGGTTCTYDYIDEVDFPGTQNHCTPSRSKDDYCDYYLCQKNG